MSLVIRLIQNCETYHFYKNYKFNLNKNFSQFSRVIVKDLNLDRKISVVQFSLRYFYLVKVFIFLSVNCVAGFPKI